MIETWGREWSDYMWASVNESWKISQLINVIVWEIAIQLGNWLITLDYWHVAISIGCVFVGEQFAHEYHEEIGEMDEPEIEIESSLELQMGQIEKIRK